MSESVRQVIDTSEPTQRKKSGPYGRKKFQKASKGQPLKFEEKKVDCKEVRQIREEAGGYYDNLGFYNLPDGSFYDPDGYYFNQQGYDEFGGHYDSDNNYIPGEGNKHLFENEGGTDDQPIDFENDELVK